MLKIWSMKQQQQKNEAASGQTKKKKVTAAQLRVQKGEPYYGADAHVTLANLHDQTSANSPSAAQ